MRNLDEETVASFGEEWSKFSQDVLSAEEHQRLYQMYFGIFPWDELPKGAAGFDMGCGSGRWAHLTAPKVGKLYCIDPSPSALAVSKRNLKDKSNVAFLNEGAYDCSLESGSMDFGYSLGVLHHIPDTKAAMASCVRMLKPNAPFLVYLYYRFDNKPLWFKATWRLSNALRFVVAKIPEPFKTAVTDVLAALLYFPLAKLCLGLEKLGLNVENFPLSSYRYSSFYSMRTDSRDRFGTPLEQRFTRAEIEEMMRACGLDRIEFSDDVPYWCAVGRKSANAGQ